MGFSNCLVIVIFNHCEELIAFFSGLAKKKKKKVETHKRIESKARMSSVSIVSI